jgi:hypothetical protein
VKREDGQAAIEWVGLVVLVCLALGAVLAYGPRVDGRAFAGFLAHTIVCAIKGGCDDGDDELRAAYGERVARLVRGHAPNLVYEPGTFPLPVDFRECRADRCADAPDDPDLDVHRSKRTGTRAAVFTRAIRRGRNLYLQYWLYYPDSNTTFPGSRRIWKSLPGVALAEAIRGKDLYPGYHKDDWETFQVRLEPDGRAAVRASSHSGYQWCKQAWCRNDWGESTGWTRVSKGSHAGHVPIAVRPKARLRPKRFDLDMTYTPQLPGHDLHERTTTSAGLRLIPLERVDPKSFRGEVKSPWHKEVYRDPESNSTG